MGYMKSAAVFAVINFFWTWHKVGHWLAGVLPALSCLAVGAVIWGVASLLRDFRARRRPKAPRK